MTIRKDDLLPPPAPRWMMLFNLTCYLLLDVLLSPPSTPQKTRFTREIRSPTPDSNSDPRPSTFFFNFVRLGRENK